MVLGARFRGQCAIDRKQSQFQAGRNAQFIENVAQMVFHGIFADSESVRDVFIGPSGDRRRDDL